MKFVRRTLAIAAVVSAACDNPSEPADRVVVGLEIVPPASGLLNVGQKHQFRAAAKNRYGQVIRGVSVRWSSDSPERVRIDSAGVAEGLTPGSARVFAEAAGVTTSALLRVGENGVYPAGVIVTPNNFGLHVCTSLQMSARTDPPLTAPDFTWRSSSPEVISVDSTGRVTAHTLGMATITATWSGDTAIAGFQNVIVVTILPGILSFKDIQQAGTDEPLPFDALTGDVTVRMQMFVYAYFGGEVQLLIDDTVVGRTNYPKGCPQRREDAVFTQVHTAAFSNGSHVLGARLIGTDGLLKSAVSIPIIIRNYP